MEGLYQNCLTQDVEQTFVISSLEEYNPGYMDEVDHFEQGYQEIAAPEAKKQAQQQAQRDREAREARKASQTAALEVERLAREQQIAIANVEQRLNPPRLKILHDLGVQEVLWYIGQEHWQGGSVSLVKGPARVLPLDGEIDYPLPSYPPGVAVEGYELVRHNSHLVESPRIRDEWGRDFTWTEKVIDKDDVIRVELANTAQIGLRLSSGQPEDPSIPPITTKEELLRRLGRLCALSGDSRYSSLTFQAWKANNNQQRIEEMTRTLERLRVEDELFRVHDKVWKMGQVEAATDPLYSELHYRTYQRMVVNGKERTWIPPKAKPKPTENSQGYQLIHGEGGKYQYYDEGEGWAGLCTGWNLRYNGIIVTPDPDEYWRGVKVYSFYDGYINESAEQATIEYKTLFVSPRLATTAQELREQLDLEEAFRDQADQFPEKGLPLKRDAEGSWYYDPKPIHWWQRISRRK